MSSETINELFCGRDMSFELKSQFRPGTGTALQHKERVKKPVLSVSSKRDIDVLDEKLLRDAAVELQRAGALLVPERCSGLLKSGKRK